MRLGIQASRDHEGSRTRSVGPKGMPAGSAGPREFLGRPLGVPGPRTFLGRPRECRG